MIKKEYIQPEVKEVKILLSTILAGSIKNDTTNYSFGDTGNMDDEEGEGGDDAL